MRTAERATGATHRVFGPSGDRSGGSRDGRRETGEEERRDSGATRADGGLGAARGILLGLGLVTPVWMVALAWLVSCQIVGPEECGEMAGTDEGRGSVAEAEGDRADC